MAYSELKTLLEKYYDGESSLKEEKRIRELLTDKNLSSEFETERHIFGFFDESKKKGIPPSSLNGDIMEAIDLKRKEGKVFSFRQPIRWAMATAASLLFVFYISQQTDRQPVKLVDTYKDEKKAYKATKKVLGFVSGKLNAEALKLKELSAINDNLSHVVDLKKLDKAILNLNKEK